jgi:hypothetical protein
MFVDEESAFWLLATLCEEMCPAYYSRSMNGAQADTMLLAELVEQRLPTLHAHFEKVILLLASYLNASCFYSFGSIVSLFLSYR